MLNSSVFHGMLSTLQARVNEGLPLTSDEIAYREASQAWASKMACLINDAQSLLNNGRHNEAQRIIDDHQIRKPKRKPGRPRKHTPKTTQLRATLHEIIIQHVLDTYSEEQLQKLVQDAADRILAKV